MEQHCFISVSNATTQISEGHLFNTGLNNQYGTDEPQKSILPVLRSYFQELVQFFRIFVIRLLQEGISEVAFLTFPVRKFKV